MTRGRAEALATMVVLLTSRASSFTSMGNSQKRVNLLPALHLQRSDTDTQKED